MYLALFRSRKRAGHDAALYASDASRMEALARQQKGFVSFKTFAAEDGETLSLSEWECEADARAWQHNAEHRAVQMRGREEFYQGYTVHCCADPRSYSFERPDT